MNFHGISFNAKAARMHAPIHIVHQLAPFAEELEDLALLQGPCEVEVIPCGARAVALTGPRAIGTRQ